jgi:hypothetical protein
MTLPPLHKRRRYRVIGVEFGEGLWGWDIWLPCPAVGDVLYRLYELQIEDRLLDDAESARNAASDSTGIARHEEDGYVRFGERATDDRTRWPVFEVDVDERDVRSALKQKRLIHIAGDSNRIVTKLLHGVLEVQSNQRLVFDNQNVERHMSSPWLSLIGLNHAGASGSMQRRSSKECAYLVD